MAELFGKVIPVELLERFVDATGLDRDSIASAYKVLYFHMSSRRKVTADDISACVLETGKADAWDVVDAIDRRDTGSAMAALARLRDNARDVSALHMTAGALAHRFRLLLLAKACGRLGLDPYIEIPKMAKAGKNEGGKQMFSEYGIKKAVATSDFGRPRTPPISYYTEGELMRAVVLVHRASIDMKAAVDKTTAADALAHAVCTIVQKEPKDG